MSSAVVSTSAALRRPFVFDADPEPEVGSAFAHENVGDPELKVGCHPEHNGNGAKHSSRGIEGSLPATGFGRKSAIENSVVPASRLEIRPAPEMVSSGIPELDALTGGLPRGCLTEISGPASSGRTSVLLSALAAATRRGEYCALIDASDALDPHFAAAAGIDLEHLLWVRCGKLSPQSHRDTEKNLKTQDSRTTNTSEHCLEQLLRATDLLLESGGFGLIGLDLADMPPQAARRIPLTTWFRFRRAVEHKPTILLAIEQQPIAGSCSSLLLQLGDSGSNCVHDSGPTHTQLFSGFGINAEIVRSRLDRKPARSIKFETKTAWAG